MADFNLDFTKREQGLTHLLTWAGSQESVGNNLYFGPFECGYRRLRRLHSRVKATGAAPTGAASAYMLFQYRISGNWYNFQGIHSGETARVTVWAGTIAWWCGTVSPNILSTGGAFTTHAHIVDTTAAGQLGNDMGLPVDALRIWVSGTAMSAGSLVFANVELYAVFED